MKLIINRSQHDVKGMLGGHKGVQFALRYQIVLTDEEAELVRRYQLGTYVVTAGEFQGDTMIVPRNNLANLTTGHTSLVPDVTRLIREENVIKEACDALPTLFLICRSFGGDEVIEYPRQKSEE